MRLLTIDRRDRVLDSARFSDPRARMRSVVRPEPVEPLHFATESTMQVVVLAAGQGKRMRSVLPKVLQPIAGKPMLAHVLDAARTLDAQRICVVYGHGGEVVRERLNAANLT